MFGWLWVNVLVPILAPVLGLGVVYFIHLLASGSGGLPTKIVNRIKVVAPFRDGQLGYVAVGWAVAAYFEMQQWQHGKVACEWVNEMGTALWIFGVAAGLIAAFGSVSPVEELAAGATAPAKWSKAWFLRYLVALSSIIVAVIVLVIMVLVHRWATGETCNG